VKIKLTIVNADWLILLFIELMSACYAADSLFLCCLLKALLIWNVSAGIATCSAIYCCNIFFACLSFYAQQQLLRFSHCSSVCLFVTRVDQSKTVQARITKFSPSAAWKTLVSGTIKRFHKFEKGHPEQRH